ncbi:sensor histidine kinase [Amnibacterium flavum]|uniref:histidine kinase n=1 Tax=Amnibacterium flavum TaxID=2173173 RepID=A0A2V1HUW0_9MICO|nr:sensor histidine kinase [Amnibacterium flavum]PVZ94809.1 histidine kinase [Amnibacterium flavum]
MTATPPDALSDDWRRPTPDRRGYRADAILAVVILALALSAFFMYEAAGFYQDPAPLWLSLLCVGTQSLVLIWRRRWPEAVLLVSAVVFVATQLLKVPEVLFSNISLFIALYTVGAWARHRRRGTLIRAVVILGMFIWLFFALVDQSRQAQAAAVPGEDALSPFIAIGLITILNNLLYFGGAYYFGDRAWASARARVALEERTAELAAERERTASQAVAIERLRIARELHDVVAHHVSVMGVQAGAARRMLETQPDRAADSLTAIEASARAGVEELHRMLGTLRDDQTPVSPGDGPSTRGLDQLGDLVAEARDSGLSATLSTVGDPRPVSPTTGFTLYRVAQEAITNTLKHAGPTASVDVRVRYLDTAVELEVTDSGGKAAPGRAPGAGLGHIGMRERLAAVGGTLELGPRSRGGYLVRASVPAGAV